MGIKLRHDVAGIMQTKDNSRFNAGMQMVQRQQERDDAMRSSQMQPLKYNTGGTYGGIGIGDQRKKAKPGMGAESVFGVDAVLPPMPAWQEQNSDIMKNIEAGAYSNPVSRQLRDLVTRQQMLMSNQTLNDAQKKDAFNRFERNKNALIEANPLDPSVEVAVRDQQQNAGPSFEQWARTNTKEFNTDFRNTQTKLIEQGVENPTNEQIIQAMRQPWDAMRSMSQPKPSQPPAAAVGDDNPYESKLDEVLNELQKQQGIGERRYGGPVYPGQTVTVGEEGPEMMQVGYDGVAQVAPNPATMARMQGGMPQPMNYAANPQGGTALPNYDDMTFLTESVAAQPAPAAPRNLDGPALAQPAPAAQPSVPKKGGLRKGIVDAGLALAPGHPDYKAPPTPTDQVDSLGYVIMSDGSKVDPRDDLQMKSGGALSNAMYYVNHPNGSPRERTKELQLAGLEAGAQRGAPQTRQAQTRRDPLEGMSPRQIEEMYAYNRAQQNAAPATASDRAKMQQQTRQRTPPTAEQSRERYQQWEKENDQWKRTTANALYNERPVLGNTPSIGEPRVWTDNKNRKITGELRGVRHFNDADPSISDVAIIRRDDGETFVIPLETLSPQDQAIVMATPDYASENRMGGRNLGTYDSFDPSTPEGQRSRQPQPRQTPTPEQLDASRKGKYGAGGVSGGILAQRGGARRETPPAYEQPVLQDGQIATYHGLAEQPGTRTVGPNGERLPPAGSNANPRDVNTYTQWLAHLGPTEGAKWAAALKKKGLWGSRYSITEKLLAQEGLLKKRGVDGYGKPYESPSQEPQFQPPARPGWWDSWKDSTAQERRLTPAELAQRGLTVNPQGQVVQMPRDPQGGQAMPATTSPQTAAQPAAQTPATKFDPTSPMASKAIKTLLDEHTQKEHEDNLRILAGLKAPEDFVASLTGRITDKPVMPVARDANGKTPRREFGNLPAFDLLPDSAINTLGSLPGFDLLPRGDSNRQATKPPASPAKPPTAPQQGFPTPDAMASQVAQQQTQTSPSRASLIGQQQPQKREPSALPEKQPGVQDQAFWNSWWSNNRAAYEAPKDQEVPMSTLTSADGKQKMTGVVGLISDPIEEIGGQRVITFRHENGELVTFYSGQLSEEDQSRLAAKSAISQKGYPRNSDAKERKSRMTQEKKKDIPQKARPRSKYPTEGKTV